MSTMLEKDDAETDAKEITGKPINTNGKASLISERAAA